jgi:hypothetical protein
MTLTDTGPLVALIDKNDDDHRSCVVAAKKIESAACHDLALFHGNDVFSRRDRWYRFSARALAMAFEWQTTHFGIDNRTSRSNATFNGSISGCADGFGGCLSRCSGRNAFFADGVHHRPPFLCLSHWGQAGISGCALTGLKRILNRRSI